MSARSGKIPSVYPGEFLSSKALVALRKSPENNLRGKLGNLWVRAFVSTGLIYEINN
ncbi:hypothetical protein ACSAZL_02580 [Methanosarcina sp. T3]|uniref:hypothetical protein n=1 Tax=Methanosarcina sp. T3 TaxID=3439062 RepID=UPI003F85676A